MLHMATGARTKAKRISVALLPHEREMIERIAIDRDRSLSWITAHAVRFYLAEVGRGSQLALRFEQREG